MDSTLHYNCISLEQIFYRFVRNILFHFDKLDGITFIYLLNKQMPNLKSLVTHLNSNYSVKKLHKLTVPANLLHKDWYSAIIRVWAFWSIFNFHHFHSNILNSGCWFWVDTGFCVFGLVVVKVYICNFPSNRYWGVQNNRGQKQLLIFYSKRFWKLFSKYYRYYFFHCIFHFGFHVFSKKVNSWYMNSFPSCQSNDISMNASKI